MKELMTYVEGIVRPVRAFAPRKLRMRRELLAHLRQAVEEELAQSGAGEAPAIEQAVRRLGDPIELTRQLQQSVPWGQRLLMSKLPIPRRIELAHQRAAATIYGSDGLLTMRHQMILVLLAVPLAGLPGYTPTVVSNMLRATGTAVHPALFSICLLTSLCILLPLAFRTVNAVANPDRPFLRPSVLVLTAALLAMRIAYPFIIALTGAGRLPTRADVFRSIGVTLVLLICSMLLARWVARLRAPYDEWLKLELAQ